MRSGRKKDSVHVKFADFQSPADRRLRYWSSEAYLPERREPGKRSAIGRSPQPCQAGEDPDSIWECGLWGRVRAALRRRKTGTGQNYLSTGSDIPISGK